MFVRRVLTQLRCRRCRGGGTALAEPVAVVRELDSYLVVTGWEWLGCCDRRSFEAEEAVVVSGTSVLQVQGPAAGDASLVEDDAVRAAVGDHDLGGDRVRLVLQAGHGVLGQAARRSLAGCAAPLGRRGWCQHVRETDARHLVPRSARAHHDGMPWMTTGEESPWVGVILSVPSWRPRPTVRSGYDGDRPASESPTTPAAFEQLNLAVGTPGEYQRLAHREPLGPDVRYITRRPKEACPFSTTGAQR